MRARSRLDSPAYVESRSLCPRDLRRDVLPPLELLLLRPEEELELECFRVVGEVGSIG